MGRLTTGAPAGSLTTSQSHSRANLHHNFRRSARPQARTLSVGMDVQTESLAVASVAHEHGAEVISLGTVGTRHCAIDQLIRPLQSKSPQRVFVSAAGPCGYWL
jgi:methylmalonyl-CoA mutase cobalamin-binding subunit